MLRLVFALLVLSAALPPALQGQGRLEVTRLLNEASGGHKAAESR